MNQCWFNSCSNKVTKMTTSTFYNLLTMHRSQPELTLCGIEFLSSCTNRVIKVPFLVRYQPVLLVVVAPRLGRLAGLRSRQTTDNCWV